MATNRPKEAPGVYAARENRQERKESFKTSYATLHLVSCVIFGKSWQKSMKLGHYFLIDFVAALRILLDAVVLNMFVFILSRFWQIFIEIQRIVEKLCLFFDFGSKIQAHISTHFYVSRAQVS